jgi:3,4-dihydroxy 2-butanone 4-phosphate synthase / GTP cyclohydrolase II
MTTASTVTELVQRAEESSLASQRQIEFASIEDTVRDLKAGRMIVVIDDEDRENEGDLIMAAEMITPAAINFMATHGRGLICLAMTGERLDHLQLTPMVPSNRAQAARPSPFRSM